MPLDVSQSGSGEPGKHGKMEEHGKKFGKKMGNAGMSPKYYPAIQHIQKLTFFCSYLRCWCYDRFQHC